VCTVAFLPLGGGGYLLGHNRDESVSRARGEPPALRETGGRKILAPRDPEGYGSWIGVNDAGVTACILNAAHVDPSRLPPTPPSRGLILWKMLPVASIEEAGALLDADRSLLESVRAFQIVVAVPGTPSSRSSPARIAGRTPSSRTGWFRWDGRTLARGESDGPALFVSSGYDQDAAAHARGIQWRAFLEAPGAGAAEEATALPRLALWLTSHEPERGALSVCMHRREARSVSRTLVSVGGDAAVLRYHDGSPCDDAAPEYRSDLPLA